MDQNFPNNELKILNCQIREAYGKVLYTQVCHEKISERLTSRNGNIKIAQIILSALTTCGFIASLSIPEKWASSIGLVFSTVLLILNSYAKGFDLISLSKEHQLAANKLWKIREEYISLLADFTLLEYCEVLQKRDDLQTRTHKAYLESPRTDRKSYKEAQRALKLENEQSFSDSEIDSLLPQALRRPLN